MARVALGLHEGRAHQDFLLSPGPEGSPNDDYVEEHEDLEAEKGDIDD